MKIRNPRQVPTSVQRADSSRADRTPSDAQEVKEEVNVDKHASSTSMAPAPRPQPVSVDPASSFGPLTAPERATSASVLGPTTKQSISTNCRNYRQTAIEAMERLNRMVQSESLGTLILSFDTPEQPSSELPRFDLICERLGVGHDAAGACADLLRYIGQPGVMAALLEHHGPQDAQDLETLGTSGLVRALMEFRKATRSIALAHCNAALDAFIEDSIATGLLTPDDVRVAAFREVRGWVHRDEVLRVGEPVAKYIAQMADLVGQTNEQLTHAVWLGWRQDQQEAFDRQVADVLPAALEKYHLDD